MGREKASAHIVHQTTGSVPRAHLPSLLIVRGDKLAEAELGPLVDEAVKWFLDGGGRISRLEAACPSTATALRAALEARGFRAPQSGGAVPPRTALLRTSSLPAGHDVLSTSSEALKAFVSGRLAALGATGAPEEKHALLNILGRLLHDLGDPKGAVQAYTSALILNPRAGAVFRNLGSAYQSTGDLQLAFASYQQAVQLEPDDALVYLKLAYFYEDFASKDWQDAADHCAKCYEYYLSRVDPEDTAVLTRLGNLMVREHRPEEALRAYERALQVDATAENIWFNRAHAQVKLGDYAGARESLARTLQLDPTITAARHMLVALSEDQAAQVASSDVQYVRELFDGYAETYDEHGKKLVYSAPRVIRQEMAKLYKARMGEDKATQGRPPAEEPPTAADLKAMAPGAHSGAFAPATQPVGSGCSTYTSFLNGSLDILDIGCGTGLAGAWLKDYAKSLVGVDLSERMIGVARKKLLYQELHVQPLETYLGQCRDSFDMVVAADVLSYVGDLSRVFQQVSSVLRSGGHFAFTVESVPADAAAPARGYLLLRSGRFGYTRSYIDGLISALGAGFTVPLSREFSPRLDAGEAVPGFLYIVEKN